MSFISPFALSIQKLDADLWEGWHPAFGWTLAWIHKCLVVFPASVF